jgi:hypothetical protein
MSFEASVPRASSEPALSRSGLGYARPVETLSRRIADYLLGGETLIPPFPGLLRCRTRWQFKRTGCPFCETNAQRLASVSIEGERGLRIDHCESRGGYLKTYDGEALLLPDWSSLHLDVIAHDRGLKRLAASLYEFEPVRHP